VSAAGHRRIELAALRPRDDRIEITVPPPDATLSPLAHAARAAARVAMNAEQLDPARDLAIHVDVDATVSMVGRVDDGSLAAMVDVLVGVAHAVECRSLAVHLLGPRPIPLPVDPPADITERLRDELAELGPGVGLTPSGSGANSATPVVFTVTDLVRPRSDDDTHTRRDLILDPAAPEVGPADAASIAIPAAALAALVETATVDRFLDRLVRALLDDLTVPFAGAAA
jgi:hypothetical protein